MCFLFLGIVFGVFFVGFALILRFTCLLSFILIFVSLHISTSEFGLINKPLNKGVVVFAL